LPHGQPRQAAPSRIKRSALRPALAAEVADAVWDEATTAHTTSGTFGEQLKTDVDAILDDTGTSGVALAASSITATVIATDAIGAAEIATDAIGAAEVDASAIGSSEIADGGITSTEFGSGAITATVIASDAITSAEVADGTIDAATFATGAITATVIAADAITSSEVADGAVDAGAIADNAIDEATFATTAGSFEPLGIVDQGTAQSATSTTVVLRAAAAFADDELNGLRIFLTGGTGAGQVREITDYVSATDTASVATWTTTPSGTITYQVTADVANASGGGGLDAAGVRGAVGLASANLDTQLAAIDDYVDSEVAAILADTGTDGVVLGANSITASVIATDAIGATEIATDAIGATEIAAAAITSSEFGTGAIDATVIAADAIGASELAADAITSAELASSGVTEIQSGLSTLSAAGVRTAIGMATADLDAQLVAIDDAVDTEVASILATSDELADTLQDQGGGVFGFTAAALQDGPGGGSGGSTASEIATAVWDEVLDDTVTTKEAVCYLLAALVNESTYSNPTIQFLDAEGNTVVITTTLDGEGSRTGVTLSACGN
jgi:hypothetical protein